MAERGRMARSRRMAANRRSMTNTPSTPSNRRTRAQAQRNRVAASRPAPQKSEYRTRLDALNEADRKRRAANRAAAEKARATNKAAATKARRKPATTAAKPMAKRSKFGVGSAKTVMHKGKRLANVSAEQLKKTGLTLRQYMNKWNKTGSRPR